MAENVEKKQAIKKLNKLTAYKRVFSTQDGKVVLLDMMRSHFVLSSTFSGENTHESASKDGERMVVLRILKILNMDLSSLQKHIEEIEKDVRTNDAYDPTQ